jgi:hypothetical protein
MDPPKHHDNSSDKELGKTSVKAERKEGNQQPITSVKVTGISKNVTVNHLKEIFSVVGVVGSAEIPTNPITHKPLSYAVVNYSTVEGKEAAIKLMHDGQIDGIKISVEENIKIEEAKEEKPARKEESVEGKKEDTHRRDRNRKYKNQSRERSRHSSSSKSKSRSSESGSISPSKSLISSESSSSSLSK